MHLQVFRTRLESEKKDEYNAAYSGILSRFLVSKKGYHRIFCFLENVCIVIFLGDWKIPWNTNGHNGRQKIANSSTQNSWALSKLEITLLWL